MLPSNIELLNHILDEASFVLNIVTGKEKDFVINDPVLSRAIIRSLEIIGEASACLIDLKIPFSISSTKYLPSSNSVILEVNF